MGETRTECQWILIWSSRIFFAIDGNTGNHFENFLHHHWSYFPAFMIFYYLITPELRLKITIVKYTSVPRHTKGKSK